MVRSSRLLDRPSHARGPHPSGEKGQQPDRQGELDSRFDQVGCSELVANRGVGDWGVRLLFGTWPRRGGRADFNCG